MYKKLFKFLMVLPILALMLIGIGVSANEKEDSNSGERSLITSTWGTSSVTFDDVSGTLTVETGTIAGYNAPNSINLPGIDRSKVLHIYFKDGVQAPKDSSRLFDETRFGNLESIKGSLNTTDVTNMSNMFWWARSLETLDVSEWDTGNVTDMRNMFDSAS